MQYYVALNRRQFYTHWAKSSQFTQDSPSLYLFPYSHSEEPPLDRSPTIFKKEGKKGRKPKDTLTKVSASGLPQQGTTNWLASNNRS